MSEKPKQEVVDEREVQNSNFKQVENKKGFNIFETLRPLLYIIAPILILILSIPLLILIFSVYGYKKHQGHRSPLIGTFKWFYDKKKYLGW
ncbi:MAG: hypothetical protein ABEJ02_03765 [Candidatus Paceibacteria bacterium]